MTLRENAAVLETYLHNIRNIEEMPPGPVELDALDAAVETMKAAVENVEYGAFAWDKQRGMFVQIGRSVPVKKGNWYFTGEQRTGCCVCGFGCHLEPVPNRLQRLRTSDNDKHRRMCEGCLQIKNHGMTYEQALNYAGIPTEEVQEDE